MSILHFYLVFLISCIFLFRSIADMGAYVHLLEYNNIEVNIKTSFKKYKLEIQLVYLNLFFIFCLTIKE